MTGERTGGMEFRAETSDFGTPLPQHTGVGGLTLGASRALPEDHSGGRARAALLKWSGDAPGHKSAAERASDFPFAEILPHYQVAGRLFVSRDFLTDLRNVTGVLLNGRGVQDESATLLAGWLRSATDQRDGSYETYLGSELITRAVAATGRDEEEVLDELIVALLADLAAYEASTQLVAPASRRQRARTVAAAQALQRVGQLAPRAAAGSSGKDPAVLLHAVAPPLRYAVDTSMMPITPFHDEYMFMRCVQLFETLYWQIVRCLTRAVNTLLRGEQMRTCGQLADAASRLEAMPALYRLLTTMPREVFAVIRGLTDGRSAIQSRPYRLVEMIAAPRALGADILDKIPALAISGPTFQEAFTARRDHLDASALGRLTAAMTRLDTSWRAMKRTHWGITRKIIGDVPGTGGTTGVHYLEAAAGVPLFPVLAQDGDPDDSR